MKLTELFVSSVVLGVIALASPQLPATAVVSKSNLSPLEAAGAIILADALGLDATFIVGTRQQIGVPIYELAPVFVLYKDSHVAPVTIWKRKKNRGWGEIAHELGVHPGDFNKARVAGCPIERWVWMDAVNRRYDWKADDWKRYQSWKQEDVVALAYYSNGDRNRARSMAATYSKTKDWKSVTHQHGGNDQQARGKPSGNGGAGKETGNSGASHKGGGTKNRGDVGGGRGKGKGG